MNKKKYHVFHMYSDKLEKPSTNLIYLFAEHVNPNKLINELLREINAYHEILEKESLSPYVRNLFLSAIHRDKNLIEEIKEHFELCNC